LARITGTRKNKHAFTVEGPRAYTAAVLKSFIGLGRSPAERAAFGRMLRFVEIGRFDEYSAVEGNIGIVNSEEIALLKLAGFLERDLSWMDAETKVSGKPAYIKRVRAAFSALEKEIGYKGKSGALVSHLVRKASRIYGWP